MKKILFQGDSITDCRRDRENDSYTGMGYALLVKAQLGAENPGEYEFFNRGIGGNRIVDLYARIKTDIINLAPDYISILIGVNDVWHELDKHNGVDEDKYETIYCMLIKEIREALPDVKIMILEPFCLKGSATENTEQEPDRWNIFSSEVRKRAQKAKEVARKFNLPFVTLQDKFDKASKLTANTLGNNYWLKDGVHPTAMGHELIKKAWIKAFENWIV